MGRRGWAGTHGTHNEYCPLSPVHFFAAVFWTNGAWPYIFFNFPFSTRMVFNPCIIRNNHGPATSQESETDSPQTLCRAPQGARQGVEAQIEVSFCRLTAWTPPAGKNTVGGVPIFWGEFFSSASLCRMFSGGKSSMDVHGYTRMAAARAESRCRRQSVSIRALPRVDMRM